jgi:hypothetical protein
MPGQQFSSDDRFERLLRADLREMLKVPAGRRVLWAVLNKSNLMGLSYNENPLTMARNEGIRMIGHWLAQETNAAVPNELYKLLAETPYK